MPDCGTGGWGPGDWGTGEGTGDTSGEVTLALDNIAAGARFWRFDDCERERTGRGLVVVESGCRVVCMGCTADTDCGSDAVCAWGVIDLWRAMAEGGSVTSCVLPGSEVRACISTR